MRRFRNQMGEAVRLHTILLDALGDDVVAHGDLSARPLHLDLRLPLPPRVSVYLFGLTPHDGKRAVGTYLSTVPDEVRARESQISEAGKSNRLDLVMGYESEWRAFVLWDALCFPILSRRRSLMVSDQTLVGAFTGQVTEELRTVWGATGTEVVLAAREDRLGLAIARRFEMSLQQLIGGG